MKSATLKIKPTFVFIITLLGLTATADAVAHSQVGTLGVPASATDVYLVTCTSNAGGESYLLQARILDATETTGGGKMSAVIYRANVAATASDHVRVDRGEGCAGFNDVTKDTSFGPFASVALGNGVYRIMVHKLKDGVKNYLVEYHCKSKDGLHTGTATILVQDQ